MEWLNKNGLVKGHIPAQTECPFLPRCGLQTRNCPSLENENLRSQRFSCAAARAFSLIIEEKIKGLTNEGK